MKLDPRLLKEARHAQTLLLFSIFLGLLGGIFGVLQAFEVTKVINQVFLHQVTLGSITLTLLSILLIIVGRTGFIWASEVSAARAASRLKQGLRERLFDHIFKLGPAYLKSEAGEIQARTGELVTIATEGIDALEVYFSQYLPQVALAALIPLSILIFVFPMDLLSGVIFLVTAPLLPLFMYLIGSAAETLTRRQWQGLSRMSAYFLDVLQGLTTLKSLGRSRDQVDIIRKVSEQYRQSTMSVLKVTFLSALVLELIATLSTAVVAVEIGLRLLYGKLAFEQAFFILLLAPEFYQSLRLLGTRFHAGMAGVEAAKRIFEILDAPAAKVPPAELIGVQLPMKAIAPPSISINNVSYSYSDGREALHGVSFNIPPGKMTALTGESGAGKTTLTWLLLRFLPTQSGQISVDNQSLTDLPISSWLDGLAWVPQDPYLFNDTILANIKLARPDTDEASIRNAVHLAHADEFIQELPSGYQTKVGERGVRLSAGQAQRIALARAFLKDAPFLILDEATSHLDPQTDALVRSSMERLCAGRTALVIAHHLNTLAMADQVITLSHGRVESIRDVIQTTRGLAPPLLESSPGLDTVSFPVKAENVEPVRLSKRPVGVRLIKLLYPSIGRIALSIGLGFATISSGVGLMATAAYIISVAALHPSIAELQVAIVGVRFFGLTRGVFRYLERLVSHDTTFRLLARWRVRFYQALEPLAPARLMGYHSGDLLTRLVSDIGALESLYVRSISPPLVAFLTAAFTTLFLGSFASQLAWGLVVFLVLAGLGLPLVALFFSRKLGPEIIEARAGLSTLIVDGVQGMADLLTCGRASSHLGRIRQAGENVTRLQTRMSVQSALLTAFENLLASLCMLTILILAVPLVSQGRLDGVLLGVVALIAITSFEAMQPLPQAAQNFDASLAAARRLYELVDAAPSVVDPPKILSLPPQINMEVRHLNFQYPERREQSPMAVSSPFVLRDISFTLPHGKHLALVGPSGAGKTTLVNILQRYWEYQHGSILLEGREFKEYSQEEIRKRMAIISQGTYLFCATIRENLLVSKPQATEDEIKNAVRQANLDEFIASLPAGFDTWIGEHGLRLSAGERQRLAIARALLKDAPLIILDEPTANLDLINELAILNSIHSISQGRSMITITQHMLSLEDMDEILVLQDGCIVERGTHDQLIMSRGYYSSMCDLYHNTI